MAVFHVKTLGEFPWNRGGFTVGETIQLEDATNRDFDELVAQYNKRRELGIAAFAWLAMTRNGRREPWSAIAALPQGSIGETFDDEVEAAVTAVPEEATPDPRPAPPVVKRGGKPQKRGGSRRR